MVISFDDSAGGFVIVPDFCEDCGTALYDTGCDAPDCTGRHCPNCGEGCDIDFRDAEDEGSCAWRHAHEHPDDRRDRVNRERAAFGLSPITDQ